MFQHAFRLVQETKPWAYSIGASLPPGRYCCSPDMDFSPPNFTMLICRQS